MHTASIQGPYLYTWAQVHAITHFISITQGPKSYVLQSHIIVIILLYLLALTQFNKRLLLAFLVDAPILRI